MAVRVLLLIACLTLWAATTTSSVTSGAYGAIGFDRLQRGANAVADGARTFWDIFGPGGKLHPGWFLEHKGHLVIEGLLVAIITLLFLQRPQTPRNDEELTEKEIDALCAEWQPEPLVPAVVGGAAWEPPLIERRIDSHRVVVGGREVTNLGTADYLCIGDDPEVQACAAATVRRYGVGSCGPRGFYGTFDVHLELEAALAQFMGTQEAIMYAYDIATIASILPAFAAKPDLIVVDEGASFPIMQGAALSRARVHTFRHNDTGDLEALLARLEGEERKQRKPLCRKFIVVEGVYANSGEVAPLAAIWRLKERYRYRLCVEETHSFGVLGSRGRGACEAAGLEPSQVDIICASMGCALGSVGGFCVGSHEICDHQRLNGTGYCFSASLPPYLTTAALTALAAIAHPKRGPALCAAARRGAAALRSALGSLPGLRLVGSQEGAEDSPVLHLRLAAPPPEGRAAAEGLLQRMAQQLAESHGLLVAVPQYSRLERRVPPPSLKLYAHAGLSAADAAGVAAALAKVARSVLGAAAAPPSAGAA